MLHATPKGQTNVQRIIRMPRSLTISVWSTVYEERRPELVLQRKLSKIARAAPISCQWPPSPMQLVPAPTALLRHNFLRQSRKGLASLDGAVHAAASSRTPSSTNGVRHHLVVAGLLLGVVRPSAASWLARELASRDARL